MNSRDMILLQDNEGKPPYISPHIEEVIGYTTKEIIDITLSDIIYQEDFGKSF